MQATTLPAGITKAFEDGNPVWRYRDYIVLHATPTGPDHFDVLVIGLNYQSATVTVHVDQLDLFVTVISNLIVEAMASAA